MKILFRFFILIAVSFVWIGCSSAPVVVKQKSLGSEDNPPICTRIKYRYRSNKLPLGKADDEFQKQALKDSKRVHDAVIAMKDESCVPHTVRDLYKKPDHCTVWKGPYIDPDLIEKYGEMKEEDFQPFLKCWSETKSN